MAVGYEMSLQDYLRVILKRKWIILVCTFAIFVTSIVYTSKLSPIYSTSGSVELQYQSTLATLMADALLYKGNELATAIQFATSMPVMKRAVVELKQVKENATEAEKLKAAASLQSGMSARGDGNTNFITISYSHGDPEYCARAVNAVMKGFVQAYDQRNTRDADKIERFLEEQMLKAEEELINAERQVIDNSEASSEVVKLGPGIRAGVEKVGEFEIELERVRAELDQAENELKQASSEMQDEATSSAYIQNHPQIAALRGSLVQAELDLSMKLRQLMPRHPEVREAEEKVKRLRTELELTIGKLFKTRTTDLESRIVTLKARETALSQALPQLRALERPPEDQIEKARLTRDILSREKLFSFFRDKLEEKKYDRLVSPDNSIEIVEPAGVARLTYPNKSTNSLVGMAIGLMLGFALAFVVEAMDTSIGTIEDVERTTGLAVLGVIPSIAADDEESKADGSVVTFNPDRARTRDVKERLLELDSAVQRTGGLPIGGLFKPQLITYYDPKSPISEAYRTLRTNVQFKGFLGDAKTLTITSSGPQEGKTTTLCNLAVTMAQSGQKVLAVGCNLRRPALHKILGINKKPGVTDVLIGARDWRDVVQKTGIENLDAFCSGPIPPNPSELLGSPEMTEMIRQVREAYDVVIFDCPPVLPVTDAAVLSSKIDCVLLVYYVNKAAREALLRAKVQLENVGAKILGVVLNHIPAEGRLGYSYYYYHYHYYGESSRDEKAKLQVAKR